MCNYVQLHCVQLQLDYVQLQLHFVQLQLCALHYGWNAAVQIKYHQLNAAPTVQCNVALNIAMFPTLYFCPCVFCSSSAPVQIYDMALNCTLACE